MKICVASHLEDWTASFEESAHFIFLSFEACPSFIDSSHRWARRKLPKRQGKWERGKERKMRGCAKVAFFSLSNHLFLCTLLCSSCALSWCIGDIMRQNPWLSEVACRPLLLRAGELTKKKTKNDRHNKRWSTTFHFAVHEWCRSSTSAISSFT